MSEILLWVMGAVALGIVAWVDHVQEKQAEQARSDAARALGLRPSQREVGDHLADFSFAGVVDGVQVRIGQRTNSDGESSTDWLLLAAAIPGESTLRLARIKPGRAQVRSWVLGVARFDACLSLEGDEAEVLGVLDEPTCVALCELREREERHEGSMVESGILKLRVRSSLTADNLEVWVRRGVGVARALAVPSVLEARLAKNAEESPHDEVARRNLEVLARRFPGSPTTLAALRRGLGSSRLCLRLQAAKLLDGEEADRVLSELVRARTRQVPNAVRVDALGVLIHRRTAADLQSLIAGVLTEPSSPLRIAAINAVGELGDDSHYGALQNLLHTDDQKEGLALVAALKSVRCPPGETLLCQLIQRNPDNYVRRRAVEVLAVQGTLASVAVLFPLSKALLPHGGVTAAARRAIRAIQARAEGGARGELQLSAQGAPAGALAAPLEVGALASAAMGGRRT